MRRSSGPHDVPPVPGAETEPDITGSDQAADPFGQDALMRARGRIELEENLAAGALSPDALKQARGKLELEEDVADDDLSPEALRRARGKMQLEGEPDPENEGDLRQALGDLRFDPQTGAFVISEADLEEQEREEALAVWSEYAELPDNSAPNLYERINQAQSVLAILRACLPEDKAFKTIEEDLLRAANMVATLNVLTPDTPGYREHAAEIAQDLLSTEKELLARERKVPLSWLRHQSEEYDFSESSFAHYLSFQIQYLKETPESWSRIDLLISLLGRRRDPDGTLVMRPVEDVAHLWSVCLPHSRTDPDLRKKAMEFFAEARRRIATLREVEDLFTTGYYIDVLGYKLSLRRDYFDPPILYAAAELNVALDNWLEAHEDRNTRALDKQFAEAHAVVRKIFLRQRLDPQRLTQFWSRQLAAMAPVAKPDEWKPKKPTKPSALRRLILPAGLVIALVIAVPTVHGFLDEQRRDLKSFPDAEVIDIHPLLVKASYSGNPPELIVGEIDPEPWLELDAKERRNEAEALLAKLQRRGVSNALIYRQRILCVHIIGGELRFVE